jgi:hypothetical protein
MSSGVVESELLAEGHSAEAGARSDGLHIPDRAELSQRGERQRAKVTLWLRIVNHQTPGIF